MNVVNAGVELALAGDFDNNKLKFASLHINPLCLGFTRVRPYEKTDRHRVGYELT